nr:MAG TPA: hypothetical protein [Caudoviricetes sp.]
MVCKFGRHDLFLLFKYMSSVPVSVCTCKGYV